MTDCIIFGGAPCGDLGNSLIYGQVVQDGGQCFRGISVPSEIPHNGEADFNTAAIIIISADRPDQRAPRLDTLSVETRVGAAVNKLLNSVLRHLRRFVRIPARVAGHGIVVAEVLKEPLRVFRLVPAQSQPCGCERCRPVRTVHGDFI